MGSNLKDTGKVLGVDRDDYDRIRRSARRRRIALRLAAGITPIVTFVSGFVLGIATRSDVETASTYPLAAASIHVLHREAISDRTRIALVGTVVLAVLAFGLGLLLGAAEPETTAATKYGVLRDSRGGM